MEKKQLPKPTIVDFLWMLIPAFWLVILVFSFSDFRDTLSYSDFVSYTNQGKVADIVISKSQILGVLNDGKAKNFKCVPVDDPNLIKRLADNKVKFQGQVEDRFWQNLSLWVLALAALGVILSGRAPAASSGVMSIARTGARVNVEDKVKTTFGDVAGVDEAKEELQEVIGFLKEPKKYNRLGGHLPKGILLVGAPGTGKTLLARAVAGEAGVPFFSISGSEFVELYVGVGAARVRSLFEQAGKSAPCIIFIDELDAVGRARGLSATGSHDEKEQTLNQLLVEMDGFDARQGVVLLAATNRPEILDQALLRAGRFDRHVVVDRPDKLGRLAILKVHLKNILYDGSIDIGEIAAMTPGFTGADLANLVNEAVLLATRRDAEQVQTKDLTAALERVVAGLEKKNRLLGAYERKIVAYHEMGHALVSMSIAGMDPIQKISIIPRGVAALGYTLQRPAEDRFLMSQSELENKLAVLMGGRAAETIVFNEVSTGASDDFSKATDLARSMVTRFGMVESLGPVTYETEPSHFLGSALVENRRFSEETAREIDFAVRNLINRSLDRAKAILLARRAALESGAKLLLERETLTQDELVMLTLDAQICPENTLQVVRT